MRGKPTGIKRGDITGPQDVIYHGEQATVVEARNFDSEVELLLGFRDREILLFGYFDDDDEFIELPDQLTP